ncbi:LysR family transcriptional regulator [Rhodococcus aerolatus]
MHETTPPPAEDPVAVLAPVLAQLTALADDEHLTRAAASAGVPQPTLSRAVVRWEAALGVPLLLRRGRGVVLTPHGRVLAEAAREARTVLERAVRAVREDAGVEHGRVRFAFLPTMGPDVVPRLLQTFRRGHPGVAVALQQGSPAANLAALLAGEVDLVLTAPAPPADAGLQTWHLGSQPVALAVAPEHRLAGRDEVAVGEVAQETLVGMARGFGMRTITDALCAAAGWTPELAFEAQDLDTLLGLVAVGLGVALVPVVPARDGGRRRDVVLVPLVGRPRREIVLVALPGRVRTAAVAAFVEAALGVAGRLG